MKTSNFYLFLTLFTKAFLLSLCSNGGALLSVQFSGQVGFLLDEIPSYSIRDIESFILHDLSDETWINRARKQIEFTLGLQSIDSIDIIDDINASTQELTLPPKEVWKIEMTSPATWMKIGLDTEFNHSYILRNYEFNSVVLGSESSLFDLGIEEHQSLKIRIET